MHFELNGKKVFASTGGRQSKDGQDWIIFIHGAGGSHLLWNQQVRTFAYDGFNVLAPDFPGHGGSEGDPLDSVEAMASWIGAVMDQLDIKEAHLVGHSLAGPIMLEIAANDAKRVKSAVFVASSMVIGVHDTLLETAKSDQPRAYQMMHSGFFSRVGKMHDHAVPGYSLIGAGMQIMAHNDPNALVNDLRACADYKNGAASAAMFSSPSLSLLAGRDGMVSLKRGKQLSEALADDHQVVFEGAGHQLHGEYPREVNEQMRRFYRERF